MILEHETYEKFNYTLDKIGKFSKNNVVVKCDHCGIIFEKTLFKINMARQNSMSSIDICSNIECTKWKRTNTMRQRYGVENAGQSTQLREKREQTCKKLYGNEHILCSELSRKRLIEWCEENGGTNNPFQTDHAKKKSKNTCKKKYGTEYAVQSKEVQQKISNTFAIKWGSRSECGKLVSPKARETMLKKYSGVGFDSPITREKIKTTNLIRYGTQFATESEIIKEKIRASHIKKYGCHYFQTPEFKLIRKETNILKYGQENPIEIFSRLSRGRVSKFQRNVYFEILTTFPDAILEKELSPKITTDIFIPSRNLVIECYGDYWHCNPQYYSPEYFHKNCKITATELWKRDEIREKIIRSAHGLLIIWETDWNLNKESILEKSRK